MKLFSQPANGYLKKRTRFNAFFMLMWAVIFFVVYLLYAKTALFYSKNATSDGVDLDCAALFAVTNDLAIDDRDERFDYEAAGQGIPESLSIDSVYKQGDRYRFLVPVVKVEMTDVGYYITETGETLRMFRGDDAAMERQGEIKQRLAILTVGRDGSTERFAALVSYGSEVREGQLVPCGVFTKMPAYVLWDLGAIGHGGETVADRLLDLRDIPVESEGNEFVMLIIFSIIFPVFLIYALICFVFPRLHFNYIVLSREYDADELSAILEHEMNDDSAYKQGRQVYTEHYIVKETLHSTKVFKNHLNRH